MLKIQGRDGNRKDDSSIKKGGKVHSHNTDPSQYMYDERSVL